jgi:hypothetical protein
MPAFNYKDASVIHANAGARRDLGSRNLSLGIAGRTLERALIKWLSDDRSCDICFGASAEFACKYHEWRIRFQSRSPKRLPKSSVINLNVRGDHACG